MKAGDALTNARFVLWILLAVVITSLLMYNISGKTTNSLGYFQNGVSANNSQLNYWWMRHIDSDMDNIICSLNNIYRNDIIVQLTD